MTKYSLLFLSVAAASCVLPTEAFSTISSSHSTSLGHPPIHLTPLPQGKVATKHASNTHKRLPISQEHSPSSLNLFPVAPLSRTSHEKGLQRRLSHESNEDGSDEDDLKVDALVELVSLRMRRVAFLSWWAQVILTTVSGVTLLFTRNVLKLESNPASKALLMPNYFLAGSSISLSLASVFWTWATRRLARRLLRKPTTRIQAANMLRKSITVGTCLNLMGMALALFGAEQIVGGLAIKVLTTSTTAPTVYAAGAQASNLLQPLDILVVQANTNTLFSHFCSVVAYLFLGRSIAQLDPPSFESDERPRAAQ